MPAASRHSPRSKLGSRLAGALRHFGREVLVDPGISVRRVLLVFCLFELCGLAWDLPTAYGWENDGAAPRGFFAGIAENLIPGSAYRYPLFHYVIIGVVNLGPLLVDALVAAATGTPIERVVVSVPSMTAIALLTKVLHLAMACVGLLAAERIWCALFGKRAAFWALLFTVSNLTVAYYARVTNVDIAYLMWSTLALERILLIAREGHLRHYRWFGVLLAAGLATKDQAYATFVLTGPLYLLVLPGWGLRRGQPTFGAGKQHFSRLAESAGWCIAAYVVLSGAVFNPTGFIARIQMLTGTNSQDWRQYPTGLQGWLDNARDLIRLQPEFFWPAPVVILAWLGAVAAPFLKHVVQPNPAEADCRHWSWSWFPLVAGLSNTLAFTLVVGRAEHRFMLVLGYWLSGYAGVVTAAALSTRPRQVPKTLALAGAGMLLALGVKQNLELVITQWLDPRREVEAFLSALPSGTRIETYGLGVYLPRFSSARPNSYTTTRIGASSWGRAPTILALEDRQDDFMNVAVRRPDVLVVPEGFASRFQGSRAERTRSAMDTYRDALGARAFFGALLVDRLPGYHRIDVGNRRSPAWYAALSGRLLEVHGSTARPVLVFVRADFARLNHIVL